MKYKKPIIKRVQPLKTMVSRSIQVNLLCPEAKKAELLCPRKFGTVKCFYCNARYKKSASRASHHRRKHHDQHLENFRLRGPGKYQCPFCGLKYSTKSSLRVH